MNPLARSMFGCLVVATLIIVTFVAAAAAVGAFAAIAADVFESWPR
jgi:hypothetical protein